MAASPYDVDSEPPGWLGPVFKFLAAIPVIIIVGGFLLYAAAIALGFAKGGFVIVRHFVRRYLRWFRCEDIEAPGHVPRGIRPASVRRCVEDARPARIYAASDALPPDLPSDVDR